MVAFVVAKRGSLMAMIVVIDESITVCKVIETTLRRIGHQVISFQDPAAALNTTRIQSFPDLLFVEIDLPKVDGFDLIRHFRNVSKTLPIIVISNRDKMIDRLKARIAGATDYVIKPFRTQDIEQLVQAQLKIS
jgi:twitching motility two-component system response regulator PilG